MDRRTRNTAAVTGVLTLLAGAAGLALTRDTAPDSPETTDTEPATVTYASSFGRFGRDAYVDLAIARGYFAAENITVNVKPGIATGNAQLLAAGTVDFAATDFAGTLIQLDKHPEYQLKAVALIQRQTLAAVMSLKSSGIDNPRALQGKTIGDVPDSVVHLLFDAYAALAGVDADSVTWVNAQPATLPALLSANDPVDAISQFVVGQPLISAATGGDQLNVIPYSDYLSDLPGNALWVSQRTLDQRPGLVTRFRRALLRGLADTRTQQGAADAGAALHKAVPAADAQVAAAELELMAPYVGTAPIGVVSAATIARAIAILQGAGVISSGWTPQRLFDLTMASAGIDGSRS